LFYCISLSNNKFDQSLPTCRLPCNRHTEFARERRTKPPSTMEEKPTEYRDHHWEKVYFYGPTWCWKCNGFLWGVHKKQGYQCRACMMKVHGRCRIKTTACTRRPVEDQPYQEPPPPPPPVEKVHEWAKINYTSGRLAGQTLLYVAGNEIRKESELGEVLFTINGPKVHSGPTTGGDVIFFILGFLVRKETGGGDKLYYIDGPRFRVEHVGGDIIFFVDQNSIRKDSGYGEILYTIEGGMTPAQLVVALTVLASGHSIQ